MNPHSTVARQNAGDKSLLRVGRYSSVTMCDPCLAGTRAKLTESFALGPARPRRQKHLPHKPGTLCGKGKLAPKELFSTDLYRSATPHILSLPPSLSLLPLSISLTHITLFLKGLLTGRLFSWKEKLQEENGSSGGQWLGLKAGLVPGHRGKL